MIGRHMPDETNPRYGRLRAFVDGPASEGMIQDRFDAKLRLAPHGERWATDASRVVLCDAAFESGYDAAVIHAKSVIGDLVEAAEDALNASWHSEAWAKPTIRNRLADAIKRAKE